MKRVAGWAMPLFALLALSLIAPAAALASDHADPLDMTDPNGNLTDLFFYPKGDQYILIVDVHAKLTAPKPYDLGPYEYKVNFDLTTPLDVHQRRGPAPLRRHDYSAGKNTSRRLDHHPPEQ